jgi:hypothetical protein
MVPLDETDLEAVLDFVRGMCQENPIELLARFERIAPTREAVAARFAEDFPNHDRAMIIAACTEGFLERERSGRTVARPQ